MFRKILTVLTISLFFTSTIYANNFDGDDVFKGYFDYKLIVSNNEYLTNYYIVTEFNEENSAAIFINNEQLTNFSYDTISFIADKNYDFIGSKKINGQPVYGVLTPYYENYEFVYAENIPFIYEKIEYKKLYKYNTYTCTLPNGEVDYYSEKPMNYEESLNDFQDFGNFYKVNSFDNIPNPFLKREPIEGLDGYYLTVESVGRTIEYFIIDDDYNVVAGLFPGLSNKVSKGNTIMGKDRDYSYFLNNDFKRINTSKYFNYAVSVGDNTYVRSSDYSDDVDYFDLAGNKITDNTLIEKIENIGASPWALDSIHLLLNHEIIPLNLQSDYKKNITREEFCQLAISAYINYDYEVQEQFNNIGTTPFTDVDNKYVTFANELGIVSGIGNNNFNPNGEITRQEAAVMLGNLIRLTGENIKKNSTKFIDEEYFASWAKDSIYLVSGEREYENRISIMSGTETNKFSPWMTYTREQAMATISRMFF